MWWLYSALISWGVFGFYVGLTRGINIPSEYSKYTLRTIIFSIALFGPLCWVILEVSILVSKVAHSVSPTFNKFRKWAGV